MNQSIDTPEERFDALVAEFLELGDVSWDGMEPDPKRGFGSSGQLKVGGKIFAMLVRGRLVLKLPRRRVDQLVDAGDGERFDPRRDGRLMKEWLVLEPASTQDWSSLAREALAFVGSQRERSAT